MVRWISSKRRIKKKFSVYYLIFSDGSTYVGYTSVHFVRRWSTHIGKSTISSVNKKYRELGVPRIVILYSGHSLEEALDKEKHYIGICGPTLNRTKGGEKGPIGVKRRRKKG